MEPIIAKEFIELGLQYDNKEDVIDHLAQLLVKEELIDNLETYVDSVMKREAITSTAIGFDVKSCLSVTVLKNRLKWETEYVESNTGMIDIGLISAVEYK